MRHFFRRRTPQLDNVVLVESGSRWLANQFLANLYANHPGARADLVTCYTGTPAAFRHDSGAVHRVGDYPDGPLRRRFLDRLAKGKYSATVIICSGEPIMVKWKWAIAARLPAKLLVLNENGDYFWFDYANLATIRRLIVLRAGLSGAGAVTAIARMIVFPFTVVYLLLYTATVHLRRRART